MTRWNRFWFSASRRYSTGAFRFLFGLWFLCDGADFLAGISAVASRPRAFFEPCAGLRWAGGGFWLDQVDALVPAAWVLAVAVTLGAATRPSLLALAIVNWILRGVHNSWAYVGHASILPSLALFVLALAPGVKAWSLDGLLEALLARRRGEPGRLLDRLAGPPAAVWPAHLLVALLAIQYVAAGVAKVRDAGGDWFTGQTLMWYLEGNAGQKRLGDSTQFFSADRSTPREKLFRDPWGLDKVANSTLSTGAGRAVAKSRTICALLSWFTLLVELAFAAVFWLPRFWQYALFGSVLAFHAGIGVLMGIDFGGWAAILLVTLDWNAVLTRAGELFPGMGRAHETVVDRASAGG